MTKIKEDYTLIMEDILDFCADRLNTTRARLLLKSRKVRESTDRAVVFYLMRKHTKQTLLYIGQYVGYHDHTTVMHACRKIEGILETNLKCNKGYIDTINEYNTYRNEKENNESVEKQA